MELLVGCGNSTEKRITFEGIPKEWAELVTLDSDESIDCHIHHDLNFIPYPFGDSYFDEIHAYEVLEHCGKQGDWRFFFNQFEEFWRILKPNGYLIGTVPLWDSQWAWGDPGHTRIINRAMMVFLDPAQYEEQIGKTPMTDYRKWYGGNFQLVSEAEKGECWAFILQAIK